jgi:hypothetical protein
VRRVAPLGAIALFRHIVLQLMDNDLIFQFKMLDQDLNWQVDNHNKFAE